MTFTAGKIVRLGCNYHKLSNINDLLVCIHQNVEKPRFPVRKLQTKRKPNTRQIRANTRQIQIIWRAKHKSDSIDGSMLDRSTWSNRASSTSSSPSGSNVVNADLLSLRTLTEADLIVLFILFSIDGVDQLNRCRTNLEHSSHFFLPKEANHSDRQAQMQPKASDGPAQCEHQIVRFSIDRSRSPFSSSDEYKNAFKINEKENFRSANLPPGSKRLEGKSRRRSRPGLSNGMERQAIIECAEFDMAW